ncbi:hypothetical protein [Micromonospora sp. NPDC050495]|uniref:hypothetical protein n=1 Tax=Micromonospora sp. NPDC050495 TaxID=3154936 RepID=UPI0033C5F8E0
MPESIDRFFDRLPSLAPAILRGPTNGIMRIDLDVGHRTEHWLVAMGPGTAAVSRGNAEADAVWQSDMDLFADLVAGRSQGIAAVLRNDATISGELSLFLAFRRFFPEPAGSQDPRGVGRQAVHTGGGRP